jgi:hypothetical protein
MGVSPNRLLIFKSSQTLTVGMEFHQSPKILLFYADNISIANYHYKAFCLLFSQKKHGLLRFAAAHFVSLF